MAGESGCRRLPDKTGTRSAQSQAQRLLAACEDGREMTNSTPVSARRDLADAPLLVAAGGGKPEHTPVWFMRQAGRSLPEYRRVREGVPMLQSCLTPELVCEITAQPVRRHGVDAAILFSDIVLPLYAAGVGLDIVPGTGPVVAKPVASAGDVGALPSLDAEQVRPVADAISLLLTELGRTPLIGFAGAPFTLASYLVEGGPSRNHERTKALMHTDPATWHALLDKLAETTLTFLRVQVAAGVDAVQLFDSWAGALSLRDYREYVLPHTRRIFEEIAGFAPEGMPKIHFGVGTGELLGAMRSAGADVVGVDWRVPLDSAAQRLRAAEPSWGEPVVQGNLDPAVLFAGREVVEREVRRVLGEGEAAGGHIFNLGHGVLPATDPDVLTRVVEFVHSMSTRR
jgi:uroporphyrinogen decarboxylase